MVRRHGMVLLLVSLAASAWAQEWHEAYRAGEKALAQGQPARAIPLLEAAAAQHPQPGRNVLTYGTNVLDRYYPYLRLAEAHLALRNVAAARAALKRSESFGREPAEERHRLAVQADELAARLAPAPAPVVEPSLPPPTLREIPREPPASPPPLAFPAPPPTSAPAPRATTPAAPAREEPRRAPPLPAPSLAAAPTPVDTAALEIASQPPGASVYLDDELIGATDSDWGRLVRTGLRPGRHRVRLTLAGHRDLAEEVDLPAGTRVELRRRLTPVEGEPPAASRPLLLPAVIAAVMLALTAFALLRGRAPRPTPTPVRPAFDPAAATPVRTPAAGVRRDAEGVEHFGEYRMLGPLGRGGMASVHRVERRGEVSALKRPLPAFLEEPEFLERFLREAEIGRTLNHPNIVRILERGAIEGVPFFTMELVPGETLQARLAREGALEPKVAAHLVVQIAEALDYAHLKGVVHRDLKPSNVMVLPDGSAKVMDFGIARARRFEGLTVTGSFLGSPEYVAPEAIEGRHSDARSDLYSLGVLFYEALAGRRPFLADTPFAILRMHLTEVPAPPSSLQPRVPPELDALVLRLLAKEPDERFGSAEDLVLALRDFLYRAA